MSSSPILPFEFTTRRLKCGTEELWLHWALRCCTQWPESTTQMRLCGEAIPLCRGGPRRADFGHTTGTPSRSQLSALSETHDQLLEKVFTIQDIQCVWLLLLYCCFARANYTLRVVHPELTAGFAAHHDASLRRCLSHLLGVALASTYSAPQCNIARKTRFLGKLADCLEMIHQRHPTVCARIVDALHA